MGGWVDAVFDMKKNKNTDLKQKKTKRTTRGSTTVNLNMACTLRNQKNLTKKKQKIN